MTRIYLRKIGIGVWRIIVISKKRQTTHLKALYPFGADHDYDFWLEETLSYQKNFKWICPKMVIIVDSELLYHRNKIKKYIYILILKIKN